MLKTLTKTQSLKCRKGADTLLLLFLVMFSDNRESFPPTFSLDVPCMNGNYRSKTHYSNNGEKGQKQGWQKNGSSLFFCATGIYYPVTSASQGTLNMITNTFPLFLSQLEEQPWETSHCQLLL